MIEIDATDSISLRNASEEELIRAFRKYDRYFDYGPKLLKLDYLERLGNILQEIRTRKRKRKALQVRQGLSQTELLGKNDRHSMDAD